MGETPDRHAPGLQSTGTSACDAAGNSLLSQADLVKDDQEKRMKILAAIVLVMTSLTGCVAYPVPYDNGPPQGHHGGYQNRGGGDRDGDGVRNRDDRRPNNPYRY